MEITAAVLLALAALALGVGLMIYGIRRKERQARARIRNTYLKSQR
jgi:3'-phosphoadenosine 5'-phosphosulfate sulfotransferase (PAPS reductase)/FAD synthetase